MEPPRRAHLLDGLEPGQDSRRLLDVGCGDGRFLDAAAAAGWRPVGIELSHGAVRALGNRHSVLVGPLAALRAGPRFAAITFWDVLEHLPDPAVTLGAAAHLLEPRGLLAVSLPNAFGTEALMGGMRWRYHDLPAYGHLVHLGPSQLQRLLAGAGLEVVHRETRGSADLRDLLGPEACSGGRRPLAWLLDRLSGGVRYILGGALSLLCLLVFRQYLMVMVGLAAGAGVVMGKSRSPLASLAGGAVLLMGLSYLLQSAGLGGTLAEEPTLDRIQYLRQDLAYGAGSAFGIGADVSTVGGAVGFLPTGLVYFLLAPFPWSVTTVLQRVTLPESLVWYVLFLCVLRGSWLALRYDPRAYTVLVGVLGIVTFSYALVEGNVGTAYRHRAQVLPLFFVLAAVGLRDVWGSWMEGRIRARAARQRAAVSVGGAIREQSVGVGPKRR